MQQAGELSPKSKNEFLGKQKGGPLRGRLCKEAKEEGKSLREGDARCSPSLRQDTRIEEVSNLRRGLKSFSFTCLFICCLYKQLGNQNPNRPIWEYHRITKYIVFKPLGISTEG